MRSLLFVPGNKENMLAKAIGCQPDVLVPDMEDSVPDGQKPAARQLIGDWLARLGAHDGLLIPRINALGTEWFEHDVATVTAPEVWGLSIGKVETAGDIAAICDVISDAERRAGIGQGRLRLVPWIESALAVENAFAICAASKRIAAVAYGGEDYANDMNIERRDDESNALYARSRICNAARAAGVPALDTPWFRFRDDPGLAESCQASKQIGFKGRFAIHPGQIETINACFTPSDAEVAEAQRIVTAFEEAERRGRGSTSLDGRVIDVPVVKRARAVLYHRRALNNGDTE
jgi:citrate lyase subunit beta/citryl-CoA lyase